MGLVHTLVAEVLRELVDSVVTAHDEPLQIELVGDTEIEGNIKCIVVRDERACGGAARDALEDRGLHLEAAGLVEVLAHGGDNLGPLDEGLLHLRVHDQVHIPLAVAHFRIGECVEHLAVEFLHDRQNAQRLAQKRKLLSVHAELAGLGEEREALDTDYITYVEEFLPHGVVHSLIFIGADLVALDIDLDASAFVLQFAERSRAHNAAAHQTAGDAHFLEVSFLRIEAGLNLGGVRVHGVKGGGVGLDSEFTEFRQRLTPDYFLFAEFLYHII